MGICIAYKGKLRELGRISDFIGDLKARAEAVGWPCKTMNELIAEQIVQCAGLEGITLYPHRACEPLHFHFDREGTFVNHFYYTLLVDPKHAAMVREALAESMALTERLMGGSQKKARRRGRANPGDGGLHVSVPDLAESSGNDFFEGGLSYNWTKTQFAGAKVHVAVCAILRYVQQRYAPALEINDDSGYFVDGDYEKLETALAHVDYINSITSRAVTAVAASGAPMTLDAFVDRLNAELAEAKNKLH